jgi:hypothetical protein
MRFWPEDRMRQLGFTAMLLFSCILNLRDVLHSFTSQRMHLVAFFVYLVVVLFGIAEYRRRYWRLAPDALIRHLTFRSWTVPYANIVRVSPKKPGMLSAYEHFWTIEYVSDAKTKRIGVNPLKIDPFLTALRERVPNATFESSPPPTPDSSALQLPPPVSFSRRLGFLAGRSIRMPKW